MKEIWKDIVIIRNGDFIDFTGFYQVSNKGNVRSLDRIVTYSDGRKYMYKGHVMSPVKRKRDGYVYVRLDKNQFYYVAKVHRLVAQAFIPNPNNLPDVDHINTIRDDNRVENLQWVTTQGNLLNPISRQRRSIIAKETMEKVLATRKMKGAKTAEHVTMQYDLQGNLINEFVSVMQASRETGYDYSQISKCCRGKIKMAYGYVWKYKK